MKIGALPDLHLRATAPTNRIDEYYKTQFGKLKYCLDYFVKKGVLVVCMPGDVFNNYGKDPYYLLKDFINLLRTYESDDYAHDLPFRIFMVFGQHDLRFHDIFNYNTPAQILLSSGLVDLLGPIPIHDREVSFYGASWGMPVPKPKGKFNVLVCHKMIIHKEKVWGGQEDYARARAFLRSSGFDLIISGDNHQQIVTRSGSGAMLFNCGSLCRMRIDQESLQPNFAIYDTETGEWENPTIPVKDFERVMDLSQKVEDPKERENSAIFLKAFVDNLSESIEGKLKFRKVLSVLGVRADEYVKRIIERNLPRKAHERPQ